MPNGWTRSDEDWKRLEAPLQALDATLEAFSALHGIPLARNERGSPNRALRWRDELNRMIEVFLADEREPLFSLWFCAWEDRADGRLWLPRHLLGPVPIEVVAEGFATRLEEALVEAQAVTRGDLEVG